MPEILSQAQIDALLNGIGSGDVEQDDRSEYEKKIKDYDFYSPKKFTKEQLRNVESLHENLSRLLGSYLSGFLRVQSESEVVQVEEQRYYEYNNALPDTALLAIINIKPVNKNVNEFTIMLDLSTPIAYFMIDRLLGGDGKSAALQAGGRDFTDIEMGIMKNIFQKVTRYIQDAWCEYIDVEIVLESVETNPRLLQIYAPEDIVVLIPLSISLSGIEGSLSVCIPAIGLEEAMRSFTSKYTRLSQKLSDETKKEINKKVISNLLYDSDLEMKAIFDYTSLELVDVLNLRPNDVIKLEKPVGSNISIKIGEDIWFGAKLGEVKNNKAIKIVEVYK